MSSEKPETPTPKRNPLLAALNEIIDPFKSLATSPRALWGLYVSYLLEGLVYFGILTILGKYLSENVGLADLHAGWVYSFFTGGITLAMLFLGGVADRIGVRKAMLLSLSVMVVGRATLGISGTFFAQGGGPGSPMFFVVLLGLMIVVFGYGTYQPAAYSAVKRFTTKKTAAMGYAMIYGLMNLGAFFSGIISPPIRKALGIESVYWVYTGVTVMALLAVVFIMTRKVVERDTLTQIDAVPAKTVKTEKATESAKVLPKLLTPTFMALIAASLISVGMIVGMVVTADPGTGQQALRDAKFEFQRLELKLGEVATGTAAQQALNESAAKMEALGADVSAPTELAEGETADPNRFAVGRSRLQNQALVLRAFGSLPSLDTEYHLDHADSGRVVGGLRTLGLAYMARAYSIVSPVDVDVLENLRQRIKEPGADEPDPLNEATMSAIMGLVDMNATEAVDELVRMTAATRLATVAVHPDFDGLFGTIMQTDIDQLERFRVFAQGTTGAAAEDAESLLKDYLLDASVFYTSDFPGIVKSGTGHSLQETNLFQKLSGLFRTKEEAGVPELKHFTASDVLSGWIASEMTAVEHLDASLGGAVKAPMAATVMAWSKRYGIWLAAAALFGLLLGGNMLSKRPEHPFHDNRFVFFIFALIPVQTLFAHNWLTLPYYIDRAFGGTTVGENFEFFSNLNPILIFLLAPMVAALTVRAKVYPMMIWGTLVMAVPTFLLVLPPSPVYLLSYILLMSIGEAMWQPRFLQWVAEIAPEGQTGTYMGIGQFPWFLTKVLTGLYSGAFLANYCPVVGPQNTQFMWLIYSLIAMISPVALIVARGWMVKGMREAE